MTRVLVLGGTGWLGRELARTWADRGADVVCLARGRSGSAPSSVTFRRADRRDPGAYELVGGPWDEVIELSSDPTFVTAALDALAADARHWTLVSTVSVYASHERAGDDETAATVDPDDLTQYADAKVAAEIASAARVHDRLLIARPGLIVGPGDPSDRFGFWVGRLAGGGTVLTPTTRGRSVQFIDIGDLAEWIVQAATAGLVGTYDTVGPSLAMADVLSAAATVAGFDGELFPATDEELIDQGVQFWAGERSLPLWLPSDAQGLAQRSGGAFRAVGGQTRPLHETLQRTLSDERARGLERVRRSGLARDEESRIVRAIRSGRARHAHDPNVNEG